MVSGDNGPNGGHSGERKSDAARAARLRKALRDNLKRRKAQAQERRQGRGTVGPDLPHDSAGFVPEKAPDKPGE